MINHGNVLVHSARSCWIVSHYVLLSWQCLLDCAQVLFFSKEHLQLFIKEIIASFTATPRSPPPPSLFAVSTSFLHILAGYVHTVCCICRNGWYLCSPWLLLLLIRNLYLQPEFLMYLWFIISMFFTRVKIASRNTLRVEDPFACNLLGRDPFSHDCWIELLLLDYQSINHCTIAKLFFLTIVKAISINHYNRFYYYC